MESQIVIRIPTPIHTIIVALLIILPQMYRQSKLDPETIVFDDMLLLDEEQLCNEYSKDCHCGSIANSGNISLFTRIVYPNASIKIEEYDEDVPYGYKYLSVYYRCSDEEDVLVGNNMRKCSEGNWIGQVPRCALNLRNQTKLKKVRISDFKYRRLNLTGIQSNSSDRPMSATTLYYDETLALNPNGTFEIPLNSQPAECLRWSLSPNQIWSLTLDNPTKVHYVRIKLFGDKIEDLYLSREIAFDMVLKNISYLDGMIHLTNGTVNGKHFSRQQQNQNLANQQTHKQNPNAAPKFQSLPIDIGCRETIPKASQYFDSAQQKYSANYLVLDFICEVENTQKSLFEYFFSEDYEIDQLYTSVIDIHFRMLKLKFPEGIYSGIIASLDSLTSRFSSPISPSSPSSSSSSSSSSANSNSNSMQSDQAPVQVSSLQPPANSEIGSQTELEFKQKIFVTSLCELKLYSFQVNCGVPDIPVTAIVQQEFTYLEDSERKTYKFICSDKNHELKGMAHVECGPYGRWKHEFPQCVRIRPCKLLVPLRNSDADLIVHYEMQALTKSGRQVIPNDKWARFACIKKNSRIRNPHHYHYTQVICRNGKWIGLDLSANSACIDMSKLNIYDKKTGDQSNVSGSSSMIGKDTTGQLVSLPVRLIRILFALFVTLCLIIICLLVYMVLFRRRMLKASSVKAGHYYMPDIPTINFEPEPSQGMRIYAQPSESNLYESIPEEMLHGTGHHYQRANENYSDVVSWTPNTITTKGEERENSIYGFDDGDEDDEAEDDEDGGDDYGRDIHDTGSTSKILITKSSSINIQKATHSINNNNNYKNTKAGNSGRSTRKGHEETELESEEDVVRITQINQLSISNGYNQLSRSSSMFMKANSIYET